jgi:xyloglucan:xyloglucosyl transferase
MSRFLQKNCGLLVTLLLRILYWFFRFYVDDMPIRVFKNNTKIGVGYPSQPMQVEGSLWNGEGWASDGRKTDWSQAPFKAYFQKFNVDGCVLQTFDTMQCNSSTFWWNSEKLQTLDEQEQRDYERVRKQYMSYDYCSDRSRYPQTPPECQSNQY